ncbi:nitrate- and nitrite sensing domain-containing protein [Planotetraspora sp. GP83]|uniref:nitrate- and nitrite sensing domain-containing protein n=1 Tax=Planotetraspora sp. GP83 TaxID=3156264 RepID=UPI0035113C6C
MRLGNWRVRSRLIALILLPTVVGVLLAGVQFAQSVNTAADYRRFTQLAELVAQLDDLTHKIARERNHTAWYIADNRRAARFAKVSEQQSQVDEARGKVLVSLAALDASQSLRVRNQADEISRWLNGLPGLRKLIGDSKVAPRAALGMYTRMIAALSSLHEDLGRTGNDERLFGDSISLAALNKAKEEQSRQQGILTVALAEGSLNYDDLADFLGSGKTQDSQLATFQAEAAPADALFYKQTVRGLQVEKADSLRAGALAQLREYRVIRDLDRTRPGNDIRLWFDTTGTVVDRMRKVEERIAGSVVAQARTLEKGEQQRAIISGVLIMVLLAVVLVITAVVASSLTRPLRRLRREALEVAGHRLPDTVQRLRDSGETAEVPQVQPISVTTSDEIGQVARAFDEVHREAVRLAGDEARLRSNVNSMFVNLSRRTQTLVERQLSLIEGLEQGEQDEQRLGNLFKLDHLATRMRRNSENLLVLAGQEAARRWGQPVPIVDIARAALSEVENYERVILQVQPGVAVVGQSVNDVVHLVAELVENAISFSPRETKVTVSSYRIDAGGVVISVSDTGIGMTGEELAQANHRLANPPVVDVSVSRRMGLFVVGRLALRHGVRVQLRQQDTGGVTAMVLLPESLLAQPGSAFSGVPGMPQPGLTSPMPAMGGGSLFGAPGADAPVLGSPPAFESMPRTPVFGADAPGVGVPAGGAGGPFARGPFETFSPESMGREADPFARNPFDAGGFDRGAAQSDPFANNPFGGGGLDRPFGTDPFDANPFDTNPFDRGLVGEAPVDTPWPGHLPPPGSTSWPGPAPDGAGRSGQRPGRGPFGGDVDNTGPLPVVRSSPLEAAEEFLPIFAAVESDWFKKVDIPGEAAGSAAESAEPKSWSSPADVGWQAARAASEPVLGGTTSSGLPKRVPKANLVPGSAVASAPAEPAAPPAADPPPVLSPERVRNRLAGFQQGVRQGRAVARGEAGEDQGYPGALPLGDAAAQDIEKEDT